MAHWPRSVWTSVSSCCQSSSVGPSLRWPNDNLQYPLLLLRVHLLYSIGGNATSTSSAGRPLPSFLADLAPRCPSCRPLYVHVHPLITSYPAHPPPAPNPLIIFTRCSDSPAPGGPIPFTFHYELAAIPAIEPAAFFSSRLCRGHLHPCRLVSVLPDGRRYLRLVTGRSFSVSLSFPVTPDIRPSSSVHVRPATTTGWKRYLGISACVLSAGRVIRAKGEGLSSSITVPQVWLNRSTIVVASYVTSVLRGRIFSYFFVLFPFCSAASPFNDTVQGVVKIHGR